MRAVWIAAALVAVLASAFVVYVHEVSKDSDGDGLSDLIERSGWRTLDGTVYMTDPYASDTDGDGLSDSQEAGDLVASPTGGSSFAGLSDPTAIDSDGDQLDDRLETHGWADTDGTRFTTAPKNADTDGDGLLDGAEAGERVDDRADQPTFALYSNPLSPDSDDDGLPDVDEADQSLDPFKPDTDGDGLLDLIELDLVGTAPDLADTDGDGFDDGFEVGNVTIRGLNPLQPDKPADAAAFAREFAQGAFAGEFMPGDTVAWLAGNLASGGSSFVPGVGWIVGGVADLRDLVASSIRADWVSAGYSVVGIVPTVGDGVVVPLKITKFLIRHPHLVSEVCQLIAKSDWIDEALKFKAIAAAAPEAWGALSQSTSANVALSLVLGGIKIESLAEDMARMNHVDGAPAPFLDTLTAAQNELTRMVDSEPSVQLTTRVITSTSACGQDCNAHGRLVDVLADGVAHETRLGYVTLTPAIAKQIRSDAFLVDSGQIDGAHWHFFASSRSNSVGASAGVISLLEEFGIKYTIHLPK